MFARSTFGIFLLSYDYDYYYNYYDDFYYSDYVCVL